MFVHYSYYSYYNICNFIDYFKYYLLLYVRVYHSNAKVSLPLPHIHIILTGMLPVKTKRGRIALRRLKAFEGVPPEYNKSSHKVVPEAVRQLRLKPGRKVSVCEHTHYYLSLCLLPLLLVASVLLSHFPSPQENGLVQLLMNSRVYNLSYLHSLFKVEGKLEVTSTGLLGNKLSIYSYDMIKG